MLSIGECVQVACILEATARKPGNVHRCADFDDLTYLDLLLSAAAIAPILERTAELGVGPAVLEAVRATQQVVSSNANLGIVLLFAPLAAAPRERDLRIGVGEVLDELTINDSKAVFEAIRTARPGGLGRAPEQDVCSEPTLPLRQIMSLAADRDLVALQYAKGYRDIFEIGVPELLKVNPLEKAIVHCHLRLLATLGDSLIERKCGPAVAEEARQRAAAVLAGGDVFEFDAWLRADGHRRNPGATADLVAASLFVALREGNIKLPAQF